MNILLIAAVLFAANLEQFKQDGKKGYRDESGKTVIEPRFDDAWNFNEGLAAVLIGDKVGFIDETGKMVIPPQFQKPASLFESRPRFEDGLAPVKVEGKFGFIDKTGRLVVPAKWVKAGKFSEGLARVDAGAPPPKTEEVKQGDTMGQLKNFFATSLHGKWGFVDKTGKVVIEPRFSEARDFENGGAQVQLDGKHGVIGKDGAWLIEPKYQHLMTRKEGGAEAKLGEDKHVLFGKDWKPVNGEVYEYVYGFSEGLAAVKKGGKWGFIDESGKLAIEHKLPGGGFFSDGVAAVNAGDKHGYIDRTGAWVIEPKFRNAGKFVGGLAPVDVAVVEETPYDTTNTGKAFVQAMERMTVGKWGYIGKSGAWIVEPRYTEAKSFDNGYAAVKRGGKWTYIDTTGRELCEPKFESTSEFKDGKSRVRVAEGWGTIDASCAWVVAPSK